MFKIFQWTDTPFKWCWALYHVAPKGKTCAHLECRFASEAEALADCERFKRLVAGAKVSVRKPRVRLTA